MRVLATTGGGAGIGRGIAWHFAHAGWYSRRRGQGLQFIAEDAGFMTGQNLIFDGNMTMKMICVYGPAGE